MIVQHALKTALAAGILAAVFQDSHLTHIEYPVMGLIATMLTSVGDTVKAGWGRLGGSVIAGVATTLILGGWGSNPLTGGLAFLLASLCCELLGWQALVGQAGVIAALMAAEPSLGATPALYTLQRVYENGIGVFIGTGVTLLFWPERPRQILQRHLGHVLEQTHQGLQQTLQGGELTQHTAEMRRLIKASEDLLQRSLYGFLGRQLIQDNWSDWIARERRLYRHLLAMNRIRKGAQPNPLLALFKPDLDRLYQDFLRACGVLQTRIRQWDNPSQKVDISYLSSALSLVFDRLAELRRRDEIKPYPLPEVVSFYDFLATLARMVQDMDQLAMQFNQNHPAERLRRPWNLSLHPIPRHQISHYLKVAIALGITLAIINLTRLEYGYYAVIALVIALQPTLGKGLTASKQRVLGTGIGAVVATLLVHTLGSHPFTVGLGIALTMLICDALGMTMAGYKGGCFLVTIALMIHRTDPNSYIWGRFSETLLGIIIALLFTLLATPRTATSVLNANLSQTFHQLANLYEQTVATYLHQPVVATDLQPLIGQIRQNLKAQTTLQDESQAELSEGFRPALGQRRWNFLVSYERALLSSILSLQYAMVQDDAQGLAQLFMAELKEATDQTTHALYALAKSLDSSPNMQPFRMLEPLQIVFDKLEQLRPSGITKTYTVNEVISFFNVLAGLQEVSENLLQMANQWPQNPSDA